MRIVVIGLAASLLSSCTSISTWTDSDRALAAATALVKTVYIDVAEIPDPLIALEAVFRPDAGPERFTFTVDSSKPCCDTDPVHQLTVTVSWQGGFFRGLSAEGPAISDQASISEHLKATRRARAITALCRATGWQVVREPVPDPRGSPGMVMQLRSSADRLTDIVVLGGPGVLPTLVGLPF